MKRLYCFLTIALALTALVASGCAVDSKGMPRKLREEEINKAIEIALNTPAALRQLEKETKYKAEVSWIAVVWKDSEYSEWWVIKYEWKKDENLKYVSESAAFYPNILLRFGEPEQWQVSVAVDLHTGKAVLVEENPARRRP